MKVFLRLAIVMWCVSFALPALAQKPVTISQVEMNSAGSYVEFAFHVDTAIEPNRLSARVENTLIAFTVTNATVKRSWIKSTDKHVRRVLVHPIKSTNDTALRIRYFKPVSPEMLANIRVRAEGDRLIAAVPNDTQTAKQWAAHAASEKGGEKKARTTKSAEAKESSGNVNDEDAIAISPESMEVDESALTSKEEKPAEGEESEAGVAATERSSAPLLIVAAFLMLGVGFVLFKKMRQMKPATEGGPLIRPIGTHMLGPKQGLLLVDVAGEMVLLGTTDKGVQLLTKLDGDRLREEESLSSRNRPQMDAAPVQQTENPFGKMLGQFREASARLRGGPKSDAQQNNGLDELSLLAGEGKGYDRRRFRAVTPKTPVPPYETQPSLQERDELIEKLRMLKGA